MSEKSMFWATSTSGDGTAAYTEAEATRFFKHLVGGSPTTEGVLFEVDNGLAVTGTSSPLAVNTGSAVVNGYFYWNTASVNLTVTTPVVGTTGGRVVLQMITANKTVRLAVIMSTDGIAAFPALTQTDGVKWEIPLANFTITTGGVITLTDARGFIHMPTKVSTTMLDDDSVTAAKIAANAVGASEIATGAVGTAEIADNAVTSAKLDMNINYLLERYGGNATEWDVAGTTRYTPTEPSVTIVGTVAISFGASDAAKSQNITLSYVPSGDGVCIAGWANSNTANYARSEGAEVYVDLANNLMTIEITRSTIGTARTYTVQFIAIMPEA